MKLGPNQLEWVKTLESGEFKPGSNSLQDRNSYCCLGVGCVLAERSGVAVEKHPYGDPIRNESR